MDYINELRHGAKLCICGKGYDPAIFWQDDGGNVYAFGVEFGTFKHDDFTNDPDAMRAHIATMIKSGFSVFASNRDD